jgi:hypothetical protein
MSPNRNRKKKGDKLLRYFFKKYCITLGFKLDYWKKTLKFFQRIKHQTNKTINSDINTAAEAISFALPDKSCNSIPTLSTVDSIAELINSTTKTGKMHKIKINLSFALTGKNIAIKLKQINK